MITTRRIVWVAAATLIWATTASAETSGRLTLSEVMRPSLLFSAGWALGSTSSAFHPTNDASGNEKFDAEPLLHLDGRVGGADHWNGDIKLILGNFGRLVNPERTGVAEFSAESSGTSVRRAVIADLSIRTPFGRIWGDDGGVALTVINTGFIFDAQADPDSQEVLDAASYVFAGPTVVALLGDSTVMSVDLLFGTSELLTGIEAYDFEHQRLRCRPRVKFSLGEGFLKGLDIGMWGDLGWRKEDPDAFTAFVAKPLFTSHR